MMFVWLYLGISWMVVFMIVWYMCFRFGCLCIMWVSLVNVWVIVDWLLFSVDFVMILFCCYVVSVV